MQDFNKLDVSENGLVTWAEMTNDKSVKYKTFIKADNDGDKALNQDEFAVMKTELNISKIGQIVTDINHSTISAKTKAKLIAGKDMVLTNQPSEKRRIIG